MTDTARPARASVRGTPDRMKTALAAAAGTSVENYDFIAYGTASALYFGAVFFPEDDRPVTVHHMIVDLVMDPTTFVITAA